MFKIHIFWKGDRILTLQIGKGIGPKELYFTIWSIDVEVHYQ